MNIFHKGTFFTLALTAALHLSAAPFTGSAQGTRGPAVLRQEPGVRAAGMGGAYVALSDDSTGVFWNPGALQQTSAQDVTLARSDSFGQTYDFLSYTRPVWWAGDRRTVGVSVGNVSYPTVDVVENLEPQGTVRPQETVVGLTYAQPWASLSVGGTAKWVSQRAGDESAQSYAVDAGVFGKIQAGRGTWGISTQNMGPGIKQSGKRTGFPLIFRSGMSWRLFPSEAGGRSGLLASGELDLPVDGTVRPRAGLEYEFRVKESLRSSFRCGWRSTAGTVEEGELSLGLGLTAGSGRFNYAYVPNQALGAAQWVDVGFRFGGPPAQELDRNRMLAEAQSQMADGRLATAEEKLEEALRLSPNNVAARKMLIEVRRRFDQSVHPETLFILGERAFARQSYGEAVDYLQKLILVDPTHAAGKDLLAKAEAEVTRTRAERVKKEMAAERDRERANLLHRAQTKTDQRQWLLALAAWRQVLAQDRANTQGRAGVEQAREAIYIEARSQESSGQWEKAISLYHALVEDDPTFKDCSAREKTLTNRWHSQNLQQAQEKYEEGLRVLKENKTGDARKLFQDAVDLDPQNKTFQKALERTQ